MIDDTILQAIDERAATDSGFAIAFALLRVADAIGTVAFQLQQLREDQVAAGQAIVDKLGDVADGVRL